MIVGEFRHGQLAIIDRLKETVRLSEGLKDKGRLTAPARARALDCLSRFGERLRDMHASSVRTAGTSALRRAADSDDFRKAAEKALGHPIEVISGIEEARLIYSGVFHSMPKTDGRRLVLDIGGGSTELILGQGDKPDALESLNMGCVLMTEKYFPDGRLSRQNFNDARLAARLKLRPIKEFFRNATDFEAVGCSGTILATEDVARQVGVIESNDLVPEAVEDLIRRAIELGSIENLKMPGLAENRAQVWPGGLAILVELMEGLHIEHLRVSDGALREGLLYDHLGRLHDEDARERTIRSMATRYNVDSAQATRVSATALAILGQVTGPWELGSSLAALALKWAAFLHEIGLDIAHSGFERHGAYIVANADMPGFPRSEQKLLAYLISMQRSNLGRAGLAAMPAGWRQSALRLAILLRLAVLLNRSRSGADLPNVRATASSSKGIELVFPEGWLEANPLTVADLEREQRYLKAAGYQLAFC